MARKRKTDPADPESPPLTIAEERQRMVEAGDVQGLWALWTRSTITEIHFQEVGDLLRQAIEVRVRTEPTRFTQDLFSEMIGLIGLVVLRSHFRVLTLIKREDSEMHRRGRWDPSQELDDLIGKVMGLQKHLAELAHLDASTRRLIALTRQRQSTNPESVSNPQRKVPKGRRAPRQRASSGKARIPANNRIGDLLNS